MLAFFAFSFHVRVEHDVYVVDYAMKSPKRHEHEPKNGGMT